MSFPSQARLRFDLALPVGAFTRDGDTFTFHCAGCADKAVPEFFDRFALVRFVPPVLVDRVTGEFIELFTEDEWTGALEAMATRRQRRREVG